VGGGASTHYVVKISGFHFMCCHQSRDLEPEAAGAGFDAVISAIPMRPTSRKIPESFT